MLPSIQSGVEPPHSTTKSRRRDGQNLLVLGVVVVLSEPGGNEDEVLIHLVAGEDLAELGDEQLGAEMAGELLKLADIVCRRFAHQVAERPLLLRFGEPRANDLD